MKLSLVVASMALAVVPALASAQQREPGRLSAARFSSSAHAGAYVDHSSQTSSPLADCQCENRKGYDLWCLPVSFNAFRRSPAPCCGSPEPSCYAPEPTCGPPAPTCCAPEPVCHAPEPACCAPAPTCCAPEPCCGAPSACGCCTKRPNLLTTLHRKLHSIFSCKKCCQSACSCSDCGCGGMPTMAPGTLPQLPDSIDNPFRDDPATMIPAPGTTTSHYQSTIQQVYYRR